MEMVAKSIWKDAQFERLDRAACQSFPVSLSLPVATRHTLVLDLLGLGLARWSAEREAGLLDFVSGRLAIVLLPSDQDDAWQAVAKANGDVPGWHWLRRPLAVGDMRDALSRCDRAVLPRSIQRPATSTTAVAASALKPSAAQPSPQPKALTLRDDVHSVQVQAVVPASLPTQPVAATPVLSPAPPPPTRTPIVAPPLTVVHTTAAPALAPSAVGAPAPAGLRLASPVAAPVAVVPPAAVVHAPKPAAEPESVARQATPPELMPRPPVLTVVPTLPIEALEEAVMPDFDLDAPDSQFAMALEAEGEWPDLYLPDLECPDPNAPRLPPSWAPPPTRVVDAPWALSMLDTAPGLLPLPSDPGLPRVFTASAPSLEVTVPVPPPRPVPVAPPPAPAVAEPAAQVVPLRAQPCALTSEACACVKAAYPAVAETRYLNLVLDTVLRSGPTKLSVAQRTVAVFWPQENWVASNITTAFRRRLTQHKLMTQLLSSAEISPSEAFGEATPLFGRRSDGRRPLDAFLWSLVFSTFEHAVLANVADIEFVLQAIPNFTRLPEVPPVFLKLSLACLQQPQSVSALLRMFDTEDKAVIHLFVVCALLSGLAVPHRQAQAAMPAVDPVVPEPGHELPKRGVFRSLLSRLF